MLYPWIRRVGRWADDARERANWRLWASMFFVNRELKHHPGLSLRTRLWALRRGFFSESVPLFELDGGDLDRYLSNWERIETRKINGKAGYVHRNKALFYYVMGPEWAAHLPDCYGVVRDGRVVRTPYSEPIGSDADVEAPSSGTVGSDADHDAVGSDADPDAVGSVASCVDAAGTVVVRPQGGSGGEDVHIVSAESDGYAIDGASASRADVERLATEHDAHILTAFVEQGPFPRSLYPDSPNTIRIVTMIDPETREPYVAAAVQRIGTSASSPVDNWSKGGIAANVDLETGELSAAVSYPDGDRRGEHDVHPETGAKIRGRTVPSWAATVEEVLAMADYLGSLTPYVGWDVLQTDDDGSFVVIEGNNWPDIDVIQPHVPLVGDERNRRFFEHHGVR